MEENTLINSISSLASGSEAESSTLAPGKSTFESENRGGDFCNSDNIDSDSTEFEIAGIHYGPCSDDDGFPFETKEINFVWDGWEAALIVSKRMLGDDYVKSSSEKEDSRKVVHDASWFGPIKEEQYSKIGKAIAVLAHGEMCYVLFCSFKELIKDKDYNTVGESVFKSIVKFVLSVFDMCKCDPLVAIAEGKVKVDQFPMLREHDLCDSIRQHKCSAERKVKADQFSKLWEHDIYDDRTQVLRPWVFPIFGPKWNDISPNEVAIALEMLRNYEPLKEDCKMQLTLELTNEKSCRILDTLVLEALGGIDIQLLRNCLPNTTDDVFLAEDVTFACSVLADGLFVGPDELATMKASALLYFQEAVIFPLSDGCFGPSTDEVIEVIKIADHERRMQGDRFISVKHLLFGLSLSSIRSCVEMMLHGRMLDYMGQLASKLSSFSSYKLSRDAATILGDENVGLEHLVLAIFYGKQENDRTGTAAQDDCSCLFFDEKKWDDCLLKFFPLPRFKIQG